MSNYYYPSNPEDDDRNLNWFEKYITVPIGKFAYEIYDDGKSIIQTAHQDGRDLVSGYGNTVQSIWTHGEDAAQGVGESLATPLVIVGGLVLGVILIGELRK